MKRLLWASLLASLGCGGVCLPEPSEIDKKIAESKLKLEMQLKKNELDRQHWAEETKRLEKEEKLPKEEETKKKIETSPSYPLYRSLVEYMKHEDGWKYTYGNYKEEKKESSIIRKPMEIRWHSIAVGRWEREMVYSFLVNGKNIYWQLDTYEERHTAEKKAEDLISRVIKQDGQRRMEEAVRALQEGILQGEK